MNQCAIIEGILFIVGEDGVTLDKLTNLLQITIEELHLIIEKMVDDYKKENRGIHLVKLGNRLKLATKKEHYPYYEQLLTEEDSILSQAALETLAIIAYNQPVTRIKIDEIRGISSSHMVRKLLSRDLIKEVGKSEEAGRPNLYGVTDQFLDYFGLSTIDELPPIEQMDFEDSEKDLFESKYKENIDSN